jgi:cysteinyl-tRNA synthetase
MMRCRVEARRFALGNTDASANGLTVLLRNLSDAIERSPNCEMVTTASEFHQKVSEALILSDYGARRDAIFEACDLVRNKLRGHGVQVNDSFHDATTILE